MGTEIIDAFLGDIRSRSEFRRAVAENSVWDERLDDFETALCALAQLADRDTQAINLWDEACRIIESGDPLKQRVFAVNQIFIRASKIFDPQAWEFDR